MYKIINASIQSVDAILILGVSSACITLSGTGVGIVIVPIASGIGASLCVFSKIAGEYLKRKEQPHLQNILLLVEHYMVSVNYIQNV